MELAQLRESMKKVLSEKRYRHSLGVEDVCYDLALIHGADTKKASIAGILHDCAKYLDEEELIAECLKYQLPISDIEKNNPYLLHAKVGAVYAKEKYEITDDEILNAIEYHTTGRPNMSILEKIVYVGDYIEPSRKNIPILDKARKVAYKNLDEAIVIITNSNLEYLKEKGSIIDPQTEMTYEYYVNHHNN